MKRVAVINGISRMHRYNKFLTKKYDSIGYEMTEHQFHPLISFCCHAHPLLDGKVKTIVENADVVHCQSAGMFPILPYFHKYNIRKPIIIESPVLRATTG